MRSYYSNSIKEFLVDRNDAILGILTAAHAFALEELQRNSWMAEVRILKDCLSSLKEGHIFFEFSIPRMGKRVDVVLVIRGIVFVLEFKVGEREYPKAAIDQVMDYSLDLKNFHEGSHVRPIVPIVVATEARSFNNELDCYEDQVYKPLFANKNNLYSTIEIGLNQIQSIDLDPIEWERSRYKPTPTIIEAAQALYQGHSVEEISRSDAGAENLTKTSEAIFEIIARTKRNKEKAICFVTGVPGAGKTLAGLNVANSRLKSVEGDHAVFLSGNGPLVQVLCEALARNECENQQSLEEKITKKQALKKASTFIQNIHRFRDEAIFNLDPPLEKVVIFDEAQRAWDSRKSEKFMRQKGHDDFQQSEAQFLIGVMDRHEDWAVIVCLVGGGQEINEGEGGLPEWFLALKDHYPNWKVYVSSQLSDFEYNRGDQIITWLSKSQVKVENRLHLSVSVRSYRAEKVSELVKAILDNDLVTAKNLYAEVSKKYPLFVTRDMNKAKEWIKCQARGSERYGLLASSGALRLRPYGIHVKLQADVVSWFLNSKEDVRSSYYLEDVATEFDIQGLELDWTCVAWDADLRYEKGSWKHKAFRGTSWQNVSNETNILYLKNTYRVLLTRARQGMVLFIPPGIDDDATSQPAYYDETYKYLLEIGFLEL